MKALKKEIEIQTNLYNHRIVQCWSATRKETWSALNVPFNDGRRESKAHLDRNTFETVKATSDGTSNDAITFA
jgi:hypothetical protein